MGLQRHLEALMGSALVRGHLRDPGFWGAKKSQTRKRQSRRGGRGRHTSPERSVHTCGSGHLGPEGTRSPKAVIAQGFPFPRSSASPAVPCRSQALQVAAPFCIPTSSAWGSLLTLLLICLFHDNYPRGCEVKSHCGSDLYLPTDECC